MKKSNIPAIWTTDCQEKMDFDGNLVSIRTRLWPPVYQKNRLYSAKSEIVINQEILGENDYKTFCLTAKEFEAITKEEVQKMVEDWADEQFNKLQSTLMLSFLAFIELEK